jgi:hypothetical protein
MKKEYGFILLAVILLIVFTLVCVDKYKAEQNKQPVKSRIVSMRMMTGDDSEAVPFKIKDNTLKVTNSGNNTIIRFMYDRNQDCIFSVVGDVAIIVEK